MDRELAFDILEEYVAKDTTGCVKEALQFIRKELSGPDAISLARDYQQVCSKNNYMHNMLCEFIDWIKEKK